MSKLLISRCDACTKFLAVSNISDKDCLSKVREHWARAHNVSCAPRSTQVTCLGYTCAHATCHEVLRTGEETLAHFYDAHPDTEAANMMVTDIETGATLGLGGVFRWSAPCTLAPCPFVAYSDTDQAEADRALGQHMDSAHSDVTRVSRGSGGAEYQCMFGADEEGDISCPAVILETNFLAESVRHWRQEHGGSHQVRDLVFMDQTTGAFTQVSDLFSHVIVCSQAGCGHVVYTNNLDTARLRLQRHSASLHKTDEGGAEMLTTDFLGLNLAITSEEIDTQTLSPRKLVSGDNEVSVESLEITGYTCGVDTCGKTVQVSRTCSATVALSKLKNHFIKMHKNLDTSKFSFNTLYNKDIETAVNVSVDLEPAQEPEEVFVFQCPVTKGGRQCPELAMDSSSLMIHWGTQHHTGGEVFSPLRVNMDQVSHYQCQLTGCGHRQLSISQMRHHWASQHSDCPDRFTPVHNKMKILTPHTGNTPSAHAQPESGKKAETRKRFRLSSSKTPNSSKKQKLDENAKTTPKLSCDVQANFDLSSFMDNGSSLGSDSDDFEMELEYKIV